MSGANLCVGEMDGLTTGNMLVEDAFVINGTNIGPTGVADLYNGKIGKRGRDLRPLIHVFTDRNFYFYPATRGMNPRL